jgi:hypothetical protein
VHHQHLSINLINLDLFVVQTLAAGTPDATNGRPWIYGKISKVEQLNANTFRLTRNMMTSANGVNFLQTGTIVITFVV